MDNQIKALRDKVQFLRAQLYTYFIEIDKANKGLRRLSGKLKKERDKNKLSTRTNTEIKQGRMIMTEEMINELKRAMGYVDGTECCVCCEYHRAATNGAMYGSSDTGAKRERCALNVIEVPVDPGGRCSHFKARKPLVTLVTFQNSDTE